ncbi:dihydrodipicolinate synthase family protein [Arthrobacter sp. NPDC090010]|uniref:dihydrodipicolinate synthase family protein n=1 Tax=Arthrobacter sp. NPDC090010 TaxID=3363942 RepID=UPI0038023C2F
MFTGVCAFPLTPMRREAVDVEALASLVARAAGANVESIGVLGSTGMYPYLDRGERASALRAAVDASGDIPVLAGIGALRTRDVLQYAADAQEAGAAALLLAPVSYHRLTESEVFHLFKAVTAEVERPVVVYDNPGTTGFTFSEEFHVRVAELPRVAAVKIPPGTAGITAERVGRLRALLPDSVALGISGDWIAAEALDAGCELWFSVLAGLFPEISVLLGDAALAGRRVDARKRSDALAPLWNLFREHGSLRVIATAAMLLGHAEAPVLPQPLRILEGDDVRRLQKALGESGLLP